MERADLIQRTLDEGSTTSEQVKSLPPVEVQMRFYQRMDSSVRAAAESSPVQAVCQAGCTYCCHYKIEAYASEIVALRHFVLQHLQSHQIKAILTQAKANIKEARPLSYTERLQTNQRCAFLLDGQCSVYPARPSNCRSYHSTDVNVCRTSFNNPAETVPSARVQAVAVMANDITQSFTRATHAAGWDSNLYDLSAAFVEAMQKPDVMQRLKSGKTVFSRSALAGSDD